jgi:glucokinase
MISALRTVWRLVDTPIFSKIFSSANSHARRDRNKTVRRLRPRVNGQKEQRFIGAVDQSELQITVGIVDEDGRMLITAEFSTDVHLSYSDGLQRIQEVLRNIAHEAQVKISGIGIRYSGEVDPITGAFGDVAFLPSWKGNNLVEDLARKIDVPVALENHAVAAALGEALWGEQKDKSRVIYMSVGAQIDVGVVIDRQLRRAAEIGFQGSRVSVAASRDMVSWFKKQAHAGHKYRNITVEEICKLANQKNKLACRAIRREAHYLGIALANLIDEFRPDAIILGGSLMNSADLFINGIRKAISTRCPLAHTKLARPSLWKDANLIAAAAVWHHRFNPAVFLRYPRVLRVEVCTLVERQAPSWEYCEVQL